MNIYEQFAYEDITKEVLDKIQVGDFVMCNDWKKPMIVVAVSKNYFIMVKRHFGTYCYSICEKLPSKTTHNMYNAGRFRIGPDNYYGYYSYYNPKECEEALIRLEDGYNYTGLCDKNEHPNYYDWKKTANPISIKLGTIELGRHARNLMEISFKKTKWNKNNIQEYLKEHFEKLKEIPWYEKIKS
jgi:hypothetical protein